MPVLTVSVFAVSHFTFVIFLPCTKLMSFQPLDLFYNFDRFSIVCFKNSLITKLSQNNESRLSLILEFQSIFVLLLHASLKM